LPAFLAALALGAADGDLPAAAYSSTQGMDGKERIGERSGRGRRCENGAPRGRYCRRRCSGKSVGGFTAPRLRPPRRRQRIMRAARTSSALGVVSTAAATLGGVRSARTALRACFAAFFVLVGVFLALVIAFGAARLGVCALFARCFAMAGAAWARERLLKKVPEFG